MRTPHLDRLAAEGVRLENAYTCTPVCGPARAALFTGLFPHSCGSWANNMALGDNVKTLGQRLQAHGIRAAYIGKWHLDGSDYFGLGRCPDGWDPEFWYDMRDFLEEQTPEERVRSREMRTNRENPPAAATYGHRVTERAIRFLEKYAREDFCLVVSYDEPHGPFLCPPPFNAMFQDFVLPQAANVADQLEGKPEHQRIWSGELASRETSDIAVRDPDFFGCNAFADHEIGRVIAAVDAHAAQSLILYTSDHGDMLTSHRLNGKGPAMYQEIANIPFLARWPGRIDPGSVSQALLSHVDLVPTVLDAFDLPPAQWCEGVSQIPALRQPGTAVRDEVFLEFGRYEVDHDGFGGFQPIRCVRRGDYKLVINLLATDEFYDLRRDPGEMRNRIDDEPLAALRDELHDRLLAWMNETRDPFRGYQWLHRPWRKNLPPKTWSNDGFTRQREHGEFEPRQLDYNTGLPMEFAVRRKE